MFKNPLFLKAIIICLFVVVSFVASAQENDIIRLSDSARSKKDTVPSAKQEKKVDSIMKKERSNASKATLRSAIIPGWGQAYNKKWWKVPIVYTGLAIPVATFIYNKNWYDKTRFAYTVKVNEDTANYPKIDPELQPLSADALRQYRNDFRRNMDFSIVAFLLVYGLQIADAAVDAHLKDFNVSDDLSLRISPGHSNMANTNGISIILKFRDHPSFASR